MDVLYSSGSYIPRLIRRKMARCCSIDVLSPLSRAAFNSSSAATFALSTAAAVALVAADICSLKSSLI